MSYHRATEDKRRLAALYEKTRTTYGAGAYYDDRKNRLVRYSCAAGGRGRYFKRQAARATRRRAAANLPASPAAYKRDYDLWWEMY